MDLRFVTSKYRKVHRASTAIAMIRDGKEEAPRMQLEALRVRPKALPGRLLRQEQVDFCGARPLALTLHSLVTIRTKILLTIPIFFVKFV